MLDDFLSPYLFAILVVMSIEVLYRA